MSLKFYYAPMSTASMTELVIEELGIPCEKIKLDIKAGDTKKADFLAQNPNGKVPTIVHDGTSIWESAAITMYLGDLFGTEKKLWPAAGPKRGEAMKWVVWANVTLGDATYRIGRNTGTWTPADQQNGKALEVAQKDQAELLGLLDKSLEGKQYLTGNDYTLADTHVNSFLDWLRYQKVDFSKYANITAWGARCSARPAYKKLMSQHG
jgi:glutathione S-transferase